MKRPMYLMIALVACLGQAAPPDLSSPKAALVSAYGALKQGEIRQAAACMSFKDAAQAELFEVTYTPLYRPLKLAAVMAARFGPAGRKPFASGPLEKTLDDLLERSRAVEIREEGDRATVVDRKAAVNPQRESEITNIAFKKKGEQWKVVAGTFAEATGGTAGMSPAQLKLMRALRDATVAACEATEQKLRAGGYKTAEEAFADYQARLQQAVGTAATGK